MEVRYGANPKDVMNYTTQQLRDEFLIENLYVADQLKAVYSHVDRMVVLGCVPVRKSIDLDQEFHPKGNFATDSFLERREMGIFNLGGDGTITVDGEEYKMEHKDCLYVSMGAKNVIFSSENGTNPAKYYMVSAPAHRACKTTKLSMANALKTPLGSSETANKRVICKFIHPDVLETCQLTMGITQLESGSVWNTIPSHTHERRMEIYTYIDVPKDNVVFHFMGEASETRHIVMQNEQAVISPSWSIHSGAGTSNYSFIWAMGGENQAFDDLAPIKTTDLK